MAKSATKTQRAVPASSPYKLKDKTIEQWLRTGEQPGLLEDYFGTNNYRELRELAVQASTRKVRGGPRVLILPGIMGSSLGRPHPLLDDVIWIDPVDLAEGKFALLALNKRPSSIRVLGVVVFAYLRLKLKLVMAGFDADYFPFDWRLGVDDLASTLVKKLQGETASEVHLVAHSMGGLVARAAIAAGAPKVGRLIMLGTPNFGSFMPVQALRGVYPLLQKLAALDLAHTVEELATRVLATFPSLYQMMPAPQKFSVVDLTDIHNWPASGPLPDPALLKQQTGAIQPVLAASPKSKPFILIAGVQQETVVGLRVNSTEFQYEISLDGDGTVPLDFALIPNALTYYIEESHGSIPNNALANAAIVELLASSQTSVLPTTRPAPQAASRRIVSESEIRTRTAEAIRPRPLSQREKRMLICELVSPEARRMDISAGVSAGDVSGTATAAVSPEPRFEHMVIGRRRQRRLDIRLVCGSITDVTARAYVMGIFRGVTPSGPARALDVRLEGAITEFTRRRMFSANVGEIFMMPAGRHAIPTDIIVFAGLGPFDTFTDDVQQLVAENVIRTLTRTRVEEFATVFLGAGSGRSTRSTLENMVAGFLRALRDSDGDQYFRSITLCEIDRTRFDEIRSEMYRLVATPVFEDFEITLDEKVLPAAPDLAVAIERTAIVRRDPAYLLVREETQNTGTTVTLRASVLTAGEKATVVSGFQEIEIGPLDKHLGKLQSSSLNLDGIRGFGQTLAGMVLPDDVLTLLGTMRGRHVVVVHDAESSRIPWETLAIRIPGDKTFWSPASEGGMSRRYTADNLSIAKWLEERRRDKTLQVLLVINPTGDLPAAETEGKRIQDLAKKYPAVSLHVVRRDQATKSALLRLFQSGKFDLVHYAGHAFFDPVSPSRSGILCAGRQLLSGRELAGLGNLPSLVFFNACEAGRIRKAEIRAKDNTIRVGIRERLERSVGLAEAFLRGGVANYLGTYWPVGDESASVFAATFYRELLKGATVGDALLLGRREVESLGSIDWADYVHYGNFEFTLKQVGG